MRKKGIIAVLLSLALLSSWGFNCYAQTTQEQIDSKKAQKKETQANYRSAQKTLESLRSKKNDKQAYLTELNEQMSELKDNLADLQEQYEDKKEELQQVQAELDTAEADRQGQYEAMKLRIQYTYENDTSSYLDILLGADSFSDFLNKAENISTIVGYDRDMLKKYEETVELISQKEKQVQEETEAIQKLQEEYEAQEEEVSELVQETYVQIREYEEEIEDSESSAAALLKQISQQEDELNSLLKKQKNEEAAARKAAEEKAAREKAAKEAEKKAADKTKESDSSKVPDPDVITQGAKEETKEEVKEEPKETNSSGTYLGRFKLTAYCACAKCCGKTDGITASGTKATQGRTVAMGGVPLGTKIRINGKTYVVEDRGTVYGHVDVFFNSHSAALQFGKKYADVYLVE